MYFSVIMVLSLINLIISIYTSYNVHNDPTKCTIFILVVKTYLQFVTIMDIYISCN